MPVPLRADFDAEMVRAAAERSKDGPLARRAEFFPCKVELIPLLWADEFPCSGGNHCQSARRRTRFLGRFPQLRLPDASRRASIRYAVAV